MMFRQAFAPPRWLRHAHVQSMLPSLGFRARAVRSRARGVLEAAEEVLLDAGGGVRLQGFHSRQPSSARDLVVLHHGWEGSAESSYILSLAARLWAEGFDVFRLNMRDHGETHHLNEGLFHSCRLDEMVGAVRAIAAHAPDRRLSLVGYSLGGNFALRIATRAPAAGIALRKAVAICPVLDPATTLEALERGLWIYRHYFVRKWVRSLTRKAAAFPGRYDFSELVGDGRLTPMTERLVFRHTGFGSLAEYLRGYALVHGALDGLAVPCRLITALDDPIIPAGDLERLPQNPWLRITPTPHGGHCGFLESLAGHAWVDSEILHELTMPD
ncbi:MAG: YheT family hydrolase [Gammaproteobacteria bacterium]